MPTHPQQRPHAQVSSLLLSTSELHSTATVEISVSFLSWVNAEMRREAERKSLAEFNHRWPIRIKAALAATAAVFCFAVARLFQCDRLFLVG